LPAEYRHKDANEGMDVHVLPRMPDVGSKSRELPAQQWLLLCHIVEMFEKEVPPPDRNRCHSMRGVDITKETSPAHLLFENASRLDPAVKTIGVGDGGNEIGMGKIAWDVIRRNIKLGGRIACRVATDYLIVAGVSNWGAYGLATGVRLLRNAPHVPDLYDVERDRQLLQVMIDFGPLVDGVTGTRTATVDGLPFERYGEVLKKMGTLLEGTNP